MLSKKAKLILDILKKCPKEITVSKRELVSYMKTHDSKIDAREIRSCIRELKESDIDVILITAKDGYMITDDPNKKLAEFDEFIEIHETQLCRLRNERAKFVGKFFPEVNRV